MSQATRFRPFAPAADRPPEPMLALAFCRGEIEASLHCRIPSGGLLLGRREQPFPQPFADPHMAEHHAQVRCEGGRVLLRDLGSEQGTRLNGSRLTGERALVPGDVLRLGDTLLVYISGAPLTVVEDDELVGTSCAMLAVRRGIEVVAPRRHTVVITGETGTGKEVVARMIHERSGRTGPFIAINCGAFTEGLLASELFGHQRGAFTGAVSDHPGLFRAAARGTILLDELADMPLALQASLLRVLEEGEVRPLGSTRHVPTDVRVIATSNRELSELVQKGTFRADLLSRLAQWTIRMPRLRDRREDIPALICSSLGRCDGAGRSLSADLTEALLIHDWPLNVRGLLSVLSVAVVSSPDHGPLLFTPEVRQALWTTRSMTATTGESAAPAPAPDKAELTELMERFHGKVAAAARHIGVSRPRLYRLLWLNEIEPALFRKISSSRRAGPARRREGPAQPD